MAKAKTDEEKAFAAAETMAQAPTDHDRTKPAPKGASLEGLGDDAAIEIVHPETGQAYGVSVKAYRDLYEPLGYQPTRQGDNTLLPGDPRAPQAITVPEDAPEPILPLGDDDDLRNTLEG